MRRQMTKEETSLQAIFEPYFDFNTLQLIAEAPINAQRALEKFRELGKMDRNIDNL